MSPSGQICALVTMNVIGDQFGKLNMHTSSPQRGPFLNLFPTNKLFGKAAVSLTSVY